MRLRSNNPGRRFRLWSVMLMGAVLVPLTSVFGSSKLPLPEWTPGEEVFPSAGLFPGAESIIPPPSPLLPVPEPMRPLLEPLELKPLVVLGSKEPEFQEVPIGPWETEIPLEDFQVYRSQPRSFLINPQHLLSEPQEFDLNDVLDYHASESSIPIYILVADGGQRMPERFDLRNQVDTWFPDSPACVVLYYLGFPKRSEVVLSPPLRNSAGSVSGAEILEHASADALVASDPVDQLSRFSVRTSIRMFWLEKRLRNPASLAAAAPGGAPVFWAVVDALGDLFKSPVFYLMLFGIIAMSVGFRQVYVWWAGRTGGRVYIFPESDIQQRLGAPHGGGSDIVVDFQRKN